MVIIIMFRVQMEVNDIITELIFYIRPLYYLIKDIRLIILKHLYTFKVVYLNRKDFISNYIGFTYFKTSMLLNAYRKKIIIMYHVKLSEHDNFGQEAVDAINDYIRLCPNLKIYQY